jgi:hypothetical protein
MALGTPSSSIRPQASPNTGAGIGGQVGRSGQAGQAGQPQDDPLVATSDAGGVMGAAVGVPGQPPTPSPAPQSAIPGFAQNTQPTYNPMYPEFARNTQQTYNPNPPGYAVNAQQSYNPAQTVNAQTVDLLNTATRNLGITQPRPTGIPDIGRNIMNRVAGVSGDVQAAGAYNDAVYAQQQAAANNQYYASMGQLGLLDANYATQQRYARGDYDRAMQGVGIDRARLGLDRQNLDTSRGRLNLDREGLGVDKGYIAKMQEYARSALDRSIGGIGRDEKFDRRDTSAKYISSGGGFAAFHGQDLDRISADATDARGNAQDNYGTSMAGYERDLARNDLSNRGIDLSYRDLGSQEQALSLTAQQLGLQEQDLAAVLESGLNTLGVNYNGAIYDLLAGMGGADSELYLQMFTDAIANSSNPQAMQIIGQLLQNAGGVPAAGSTPVDAQGRPIPMGPT